MNDQDLELISQFIDAELSDAERRAFSERLLAEPELRRAFEETRAADARVREAFSGQGVDMVPPHVASLLAAPAGADKPSRLLSWPSGAIAASVVAATALLLNPAMQVAEGPADNGFQTVLETAASRSSGWESLADGAQMRPLLSFRSQAGQWCREYLLSEAASVQRGVACRSEGQWQVQVVVSDSAPGAASDYRPAGAADTDVIASYVSKHAEGVALSLKEEAGAISGGWQ